MQFSSKLLAEAVQEFSKFPGIGSKTALRLVLYLLNKQTEEVERFSNTIIKLRREICFCDNCGNLSDSTICEICANESRNAKIICVVEDSRDVMAIESTQSFNGVYHVLNGLISPIEGLSPTDLNIPKLIERVSEGDVQEVILALNPTMEGDTTIFYLHKKIKNFPIKVTTIARGIAFGGEIEYADEFTLARSIASRVIYENTPVK